ncbi:MAG: IS6 family transposase [Nitrososphaeria archaeon]
MVFKKREQLGMELMISGAVKQASESSFQVKSQHREAYYDVQWKDKGWVCSCEDFKKNHRKCKHIYAVQYFLMLRKISLGLDTTEEQVKCPKCGSTDIIRRGFRDSKKERVQRYSCRACGFRFSESLQSRTAGYIIVSALDLYFRGLSLRQVSEHLDATYGVTVSPATVLRWLRKFSEIADELLQKKVKSERWGVDETIVHLSGRKIALWTLMDLDTRLLIAVQVSRNRDETQARNLFEIGKKVAGTPMEIISDGAKFYSPAISESMKGSEILHVSGPGLASQVNNNKVERLNGTIKKRVKSIGAFRSLETATMFAKGFRFYYNFVKPHRSLSGKTPAQAAGISDRKLKWKELVKNT